jgi:hypothetical protein
MRRRTRNDKARSLSLITPASSYNFRFRLLQQSNFIANFLSFFLASSSLVAAAAAAKQQFFFLLTRKKKLEEKEEERKNPKQKRSNKHKSPTHTQQKQVYTSTCMTVTRLTKS